MADDQDEDVVFENSALHEYFSAIGASNIDVATVQRPETIESTKEPYICTAVPMPSVWTRIKHLPYKVKNQIWAWSHGSHDRYKGLEEFYGNVILEKVIKCRSLQDEDANFLSSYTREQADYDEPLSEATAPTSIKKLSLFMALLSYAIYRLAFPNLMLTKPYQVTFDVITGILIVVALLPEGVAVLHWYWQWKKYEEAVDLMRDVLAEIEKFQMTCQRCIRLIQESELVARGFTLASVQSPVARLEKSQLLSSRRQCADLRRLVFHTARQVMHLFRDATNHMLHKWPLQAEIDLKSNYLSSMDLSDYGECVTLTGDNDESEKKLLSVTDNYSLSAIKAMCQLGSVHSSEFIRRLTLCIMPTVHMHRVNPPASKDTGVSILCKQASESQKSLQKLLVSLTRVYNYQRCSVLEANNNPQKAASKADPRISALYVAIHSLDLHLQASLRRCRLVEQEVELLCSEQYTVVDYAALYHRYAHDLTCILADLEACKGCWEEGTLRLDVLTGRDTQRKNTSNNVEEKTDKSEKKKKKGENPPVSLVDMGDPIIEDQVFEAYTDPTEVTSEGTEWDDLSPEEKAKKKREREEARRVLRELKTVISVRASDREEREKIALAKMLHNKDNCDSTPPSEENVPHSEENAPSSEENKNNIAKKQGEQKAGIYDQDEAMPGKNSDCEDNQTTERSLIQEDIGVNTVNEEIDENERYVDVKELKDQNAKTIEKNKSDIVDMSGDHVDYSSSSDGDDDLDNYTKKQHVLDTIREDHEKRLLANWGSNSDSDEEHIRRDDTHLREKLERTSGANFSLSSSLAAMVAARSRQMNLQEQTYQEAEDCLTDS